MRRYLFFITIIIGSQAIAQNDALAKQYFEEGLFDKAVLYYEQLYQTYPQRTDYLQNLVTCYQQLERYQDAERILLSKSNTNNPYQTPILYIEIGYNYSLQQKKSQAENYYKKAIENITQNPGIAFMAGDAFRKKALLEYAVDAFKKGIAADGDHAFNLYNGLASVYGEMGDIERMYDTYLSLLEKRQDGAELIKRRLGDFISEDPEDSGNLLLKKTLLKRAQTGTNLVWNDLLSWLFIQQKQYKNAFIQEKAIYKRTSSEWDATTSLEKILHVGVMARQEDDTEAAREIFSFIATTLAQNRLTEDPEMLSLKLEAERYLLEMKIEETGESELSNINKEFTSLLNTYGYTVQTLDLQITYSRFLAFKRNESAEAVKLLKAALTLSLSPAEEAQTKMMLADILVFEEHFNQALIYYTQIQKSLKNDLLAQTASFKIAETSFYKGDFAWAESQLNVLKSSTSQLIANDALQLKLLISDNLASDSTQTTLKQYARARLLAYQNKKEEAIALLENLLSQHKGEVIEDDALFQQARLFQEQGRWEKAEHNYLKIIEFYPFDVLADDALYALAELYKKQLNQPEKAKIYYEKIIFDHADSVYFVAARDNYRKLRGDAIR